MLIWGESVQKQPGAGAVTEWADSCQKQAAHNASVLGSFRLFLWCRGENKTCPEWILLAKHSFHWWQRRRRRRSRLSQLMSCPLLAACLMTPAYRLLAHVALRRAKGWTSASIFTPQLSVATTSGRHLSFFSSANLPAFHLFLISSRTGGAIPDKLHPPPSPHLRDRLG